MKEVCSLRKIKKAAGSEWAEGPLAREHVRAAQNDKGAGLVRHIPEQPAKKIHKLSVPKSAKCS